MTSTTVARVLFLLTVSVCAADGLRILIYPYGHCLNSHLLNAEKMARVLARYGHQVSVIVNNRYPTLGHVANRYHASPDQSSSSNSRDQGGYVEMVMFDAPQNFTPICEYDTVDFVVDTPVSIRFHTFIETAVRYCDRLLADAALMRSLKQRNFDVFVVEAVDPCGKILADWLDVPFVPLMTTGLGHGDGNTRLPSHVPAPISWFTPDMSLGQRVVNVLLKTMYDVLPAVMHFTEPFEQLKVKYALNTSLSLANTFDRASLTFVNSDFAVEYSVPLSPDTVLVGGLFFDEPRGLDPELAAFMQGSGEAGVVVVSMGTLVGHYSARWTQLFLTAFARLPQRVVWRYAGRAIDQQQQQQATEGSTFAGNSSDMTLGSSGASSSLYDFSTVVFPPNVLARPWLPQAELLAHPKTRLFVTHCGLNAMFETVRAGVPVVALPLSGDQFYQAAKLADHARMGVQLDISKMTADDLSAAMTTVIGQASYTQQARLLQARLLDQPMPVADKVNYWLNYVAKHRGDVRHLRTGGRQLTFCQYYSLDVAAILLTAVTVALGTLYALTRFCFHLVTMQCRSVK